MKPKSSDSLEYPVDWSLASLGRIHRSHLESIRRMKEFAELLANNPEDAKKFLVETGIYTASGELTEAYR